MSDIFGSWETRPTIQDAFADMFANRADEIRHERERAEQDKARQQEAAADGAAVLARLFEENDA